MIQKNHMDMNEFLANYISNYFNLQIINNFDQDIYYKKY